MSNKSRHESRKARIEIRNEKIKQRFCEFDLRVYNLDYVLAKLEEEFNLAQSTIYQIIKK